LQQGKEKMAAMGICIHKVLSKKFQSAKLTRTEDTANIFQQNKKMEGIRG
jgi:hypothetical protein